MVVMQLDGRNWIVPQTVTMAELQGTGYLPKPDTLLGAHVVNVCPSCMHCFLLSTYPRITIMREWGVMLLHVSFS